MMGNLEFCKKYKEKLKNDNDIAENPLGDFFVDYRQRISFFVSYFEFAPGIRPMGNYSPVSVLKLDDEDLKYLYDKYYAKLQSERDELVAKLDKEYSSISPD